LSEGETERVRRLEDDIARLTQALQEAEKEHELLGQQLEVAAFCYLFVTFSEVAEVALFVIFC
jgi:hypothetical protein